MKFEIEGKLSAGYYNSMEACPCIYLNGGDVIDDMIIEKLEERGHNGNFAYGPFECPESVKNPLIGKKNQNHY